MQNHHHHRHDRPKWVHGARGSWAHPLLSQMGFGQAGIISNCRSHFVLQDWMQNPLPNLGLRARQPTARRLRLHDDDDDDDHADDDDNDDDDDDDDNDDDDDDDDASWTALERSWTILEPS